jgi:hypothetical protein
MPGENASSRHSRPSHEEALIGRKSGGVGGVRRKPEPAPEPAEDLIPAAEAQPAKQEPVVKLSNPKWLVETGHFGELAKWSVDIELPDSMKDVNRVIITLWAIGPNWPKESIKTKDFYADKGKVQGELELRRPDNKDGKEMESCSYYFTAKHRDSKEVESPKLKAGSKIEGFEELTLEFPEPKDLQGRDITFRLISHDRTFSALLESKKAEEKDGSLLLKFENVNPKLKYTLETIDSQGDRIQTILNEIPFGKWSEAKA